MPLLPLVGHLEARRRVAEARRTGRLPHTLLVSGPAGVGKQRFALWVAQLLVCADPGEEPCGTCPACRKVLGLAHPDVHWFVPIPRPKAGDPDKQVDEAEQALVGVMAERRERPLWGTPDGMAIHGVATARLLLRRVTLTSVEGGPKVFVVGTAERLVPQESSPDAANALLKVLEEPPRRTVFLLTTEDPNRLLPTIRSRAVPIRLGRLPDDAVRGFLREHAGASGAALDRQVAAAEGAIGRALAEDEAAAKAREAAETLLSAIEEGKGRWLERALRQAPWQARGDFSAMLVALGGLLGERARDAADGAGPERLGRLVTAADRVQTAYEAAQGNVNPQLLMASLAAELEEQLCG